MKPATELPWETVGGNIHSDTREIVHWRYLTRSGSEDEQRADAAYIVHTCNAYPRLIATIESLVTLLNTIQEQADGPCPMPWIEIDEAERLLTELEPTEFGEE